MEKHTTYHLPLTQFTQHSTTSESIVQSPTLYLPHTKPNQTKWNVCSTYLINFKLIFAVLRPRTSQPKPFQLATRISMCLHIYFPFNNGAHISYSTPFAFFKAKLFHSMISIVHKFLFFSVWPVNWIRSESYYFAIRHRYSINSIHIRVWLKPTFHFTAQIHKTPCDTWIVLHRLQI